MTSPNMDSALQTFVEECGELLQQMEDALLRLETEPENQDIIDAMFRAAHTIKGSAGLFGLNEIVAFTHVVENVLDQVRGHTLPVTGELIAVLLPCRDHIGTLVDAPANEPLDADTRTTGDALLANLQAFLGGETVEASTSVKAQPMVPHETPVYSSSEAGTDNWHLSLRFGPDVLRNGMDPLSFIRYLGTMGSVEHIVTLHDAVPTLDALDAESCCLGFEIAFKSDADKARIESAFEFVIDDC